MSHGWVEPLIIAAWAAQALSWVYALIRNGRRAAAPHEWTPELLLRGVLVGLVVWAITAPDHPIAPYSSRFAVLWSGLFLMGHGASVLGRLKLARAWGIGTRPRADVRVPVRNGVYRLAAHPIYYGITAALVAQLALLQNLASLILALGAVAVNGWKTQRERRLLEHAEHRSTQ